MPKHSGVVAHDPVGQVTDLFHRLHDGDWVYETIQDVQAIADANAEARNHCSAWSPSRELKQHSRVPLIFIEKFQREHGLNFYSRDPEEQRRINRLIDEVYPWMRVSGGREG